MGCRDAVLPDTVLKKDAVKCLLVEEKSRQPYNDNVCFLQALVFYLHGNNRLDEGTTKSFKYLFNRMDVVNANHQFYGVHTNKIYFLKMSQV